MDIDELISINKSGGISDINRLEVYAEFKKIVFSQNKNFYKIKSDNRDLNYENYFSKGEKVKKYSDYTSENTKRLTLKENIKLLRPIIKRNLNKS